MLPEIRNKITPFYFQSEKMNLNIENISITKTEKKKGELEF